MGLLLLGVIIVVAVLTVVGLSAGVAYTVLLLWRWIQGR